MRQKSLVTITVVLVLVMVTFQIPFYSTGHGVLHSNREYHGFTFDHYPSYQEMNRTIHAMANNYSSIMKVFSIGKTWGWDPVTGKYDSPREIWTIKISDNVDKNESDEEPAVLITWHHAREWIGPAFNLYLAQHLVQEYATNATIHWLVDHYEIYIIPMANADGYVEDGNGNVNNLTGQGTGGWRKNCRDNNGNGKLDVINKWDAEGEGVDPERNWDWHWNEGDSNPNSPTYHGPQPFSEPMTRAERDFILKYNIDSFAVIHSFSAAILLPWFYTAQPPPHANFFASLGKSMAQLTMMNGNPSQHYEYGRPDQVIGYSASGSSADWVYGKLNKIAIAVEMEPTYGNFYTQDGFHPKLTLIKTYCRDLYEAMIYFIEISNSKLKPKNDALDQPNPFIVWGKVTDSSGNPLPYTQVTIRDNKTGETIHTYTDENGFYMLNLGTLSHKYNTKTNFTISAGNTVKAFHINNKGRFKIDIEITSVPEFNIGISLLLTILLLATFVKRFRVNKE